MDEEFLCLLLAELLKRIRPQNITHQTMCRWFSEAVDLSEMLGDASIEI